MASPGREFRLIVQRVGSERHAAFRVIAYGDTGIHGHAEFSTLGDLLDTLNTAVPEVVLDLQSQGSILFAGEMELDDTQLHALGLA